MAHPCLYVCGKKEVGPSVERPTHAKSSAISSWSFQDEHEAVGNSFFFISHHQSTRTKRYSSENICRHTLRHAGILYCSCIAKTIPRHISTTVGRGSYRYTAPAILAYRNRIVAYSG